MRFHGHPTSVTSLRLFAALALAFGACGNKSAAPGATPDIVVDAGAADAGAPKPLYAIESLIFGQAGSFSYINLLPSLGSQDKVLLTQAREFAEYSPAEPVQGQIIVGSGERPELTRYVISDDGMWTSQETISFAAYTTKALDGSVYVSPTKALVPFDTTNHVTWNPTTFTLGTEIGAPASIPLTRGDNGELQVWRGFSQELRSGILFQPYYWADSTFHAYSQTSQIAVIDTTANSVKTVLDVPCPHLHITSQDEAGNMYFSNGQASIPSAVLTPGAPKNCFARINAGEETVDPASVVYFKDLTGGREGSNVFYIGEGKALFSVYHGERDNVNADTPYETVDFSANYHLWTLDLTTMQAQIMDGIDYAGGQFTAFRIDGHVLVAIPAGDYSSTAVYEAMPSGSAEKRFDVQGWAFKFFRVR